jgi:hypothetical protein
LGVRVLERERRRIFAAGHRLVGFGAFALRDHRGHREPVARRQQPRLDGLDILGRDQFLRLAEDEVVPVAAGLVELATDQVLQSAVIGVDDRRTFAVRKLVGIHEQSGHRFSSLVIRCPSRRASSASRGRYSSTGL